MGDILGSSKAEVRLHGYVMPKPTLAGHANTEVNSEYKKKTDKQRISNHSLMILYSLISLVEITFLQ